jgi:hypothetical protein
MALRRRRGPIALVLAAILAVSMTFVSERASASPVDNWTRIFTFWQMLLHRPGVATLQYPYPPPYPPPHPGPPPCWFYPGPPPAGFRACPPRGYPPPPCYPYPYPGSNQRRCPH